MKGKGEKVINNNDIHNRGLLNGVAVFLPAMVYHQSSDRLGQEQCRSSAMGDLILSALAYRGSSLDGQNSVTAFHNECLE